MTIKRYGSSAMALHWISALLMFLVIPVAWYMGTLARNDPAKGGWMTFHKSLGITILVLTLLRIAYRRLQPAPELPDTFTVQDKKVAGATHWLLYGVLLAMPVTGYLMSALGGHPVSFFGLFELPQALPVDKDLGEVAHGLHKLIQWIAYGIILLHLLAVAKHARLKDGILERMLPGSRGA